MTEPRTTFGRPTPTPPAPRPPRRPRLPALALLAGLFALTAATATAQPAIQDLPPGLQAPSAALPGTVSASGTFDVDAATQAYLDLLSPEQKERSDAYFEGGYWLQLWELLYALGAAALLLFSGGSRRLRELAQRVSRRPWLVTGIYAVLWSVVMFVLDLPWIVYSQFLREKSYGLATQSFGPWLGERALELGISLILVPPILVLIYAAVRRAGAAWWLWASAISGAGLLLLIVINPVFITPLFNDYQPLAEGPLREDLLSIARANGIPADDVFAFDASRQTTRISANVSGLFGTTRIALNDNLLDRTSPPEIRAVMAHEMGHYVLHHALQNWLYLTLIVAFGMWVVHRSFDALLTRWGRRWGITDRADPAGLPAALAVLAIFFTLATPLINNAIRQGESEADAFGLAAAGEPHGFASAAMRLSAYRKIHPSPLEEFFFFDHPSGYTRVHRSMTWLAENQHDPRMLASLEAAGVLPAPATPEIEGHDTDSPAQE